MVAIIRSLLSIALIVSAEAALKFVNEVKCKTGKVEVPETTATAKFDTYVAAVKKLIKDSTEAVSGCTIKSVVSDDGTNTACEEVGTIVTTEVTKTTQCTGNIYGTAATTEACNSNAYKDGFLAVKAPTGCVLTITRTLSESGGNGGEGGAETALTFDNTVACEGGSVEVTDSTAKLDDYVAKVKEAMAENTSISECTITTTVSAAAAFTTCQEVGTLIGDQVTSNTCNGDIYGTKDTGKCESALPTTAGGVVTMQAPGKCELTIKTTLTGGNGGEGNETEGGDNTGSSGVTPALTLGCLTAVVAALN